MDVEVAEEERPCEAGQCERHDDYGGNGDEREHEERAADDEERRQVDRRAEALVCRAEEKRGDGGRDRHHGAEHTGERLVAHAGIGDVN